MTTQHKSKLVAALLATLGGSIGLHRFYLAGQRDKWGWLHVVSLPLSLCIYFLFRDIQPLFAFLPLILSLLAGCLASLIIGTTADEKWDASVNANSGQHTQSNWTVPMLLALTMAFGAFALIAVIARTFDLLFTGGLYG
jgi:TM2 domain-containing membrane protein YozV